MRGERDKNKGGRKRKGMGEERVYCTHERMKE